MMVGEWFVFVIQPTYNKKSTGLKNKYLLTFRVPISSIRAPTWPKNIKFH